MEPQDIGEILKYIKTEIPWISPPQLSDIEVFLFKTTQLYGPKSLKAKLERFDPLLANHESIMACLNKAIIHQQTTSSLEEKVKMYTDTKVNNSYVNYLDKRIIDFGYDKELADFGRKVTVNVSPFIDTSASLNFITLNLGPSVRDQQYTS